MTDRDSLIARPTDEEAAELRRLIEVTTPGPWEAVDVDRGIAEVWRPNSCIVHETLYANARFIAAARDWLPRLLALVTQEGGDPHSKGCSEENSSAENKTWPACITLTDEEIAAAEASGPTEAIYKAAEFLRKMSPPARSSDAPVGRCTCPLHGLTDEHCPVHGEPVPIRNVESAKANLTTVTADATAGTPIDPDTLAAAEAAVQRMSARSENAPTQATADIVQLRPRMSEYGVPVILKEVDGQIIECVDVDAMTPAQKERFLTREIRGDVETAQASLREYERGGGISLEDLKAELALPLPEGMETTPQTWIDLGELLNEHGSEESIEMYEAVSLDHDRALAEIARLTTALMETQAISEEVQAEADEMEVGLEQATAREARAREEEREACLTLKVVVPAGQGGDYTSGWLSAVGTYQAAIRALSIPSPPAEEKP